MKYSLSEGGETLNNLIIEMFNVATYISSVLIIIIVYLVLISLLLYPTWYLLNSVLYKRTKASIYFISYVKNRKKFIKWHKETKPDVHAGIVRKSRQ